MRLRHIPGAAAAVCQNPLVLTEEEAVSHKGQWLRFSGGRPLHLEIGMGRGRFIFSAAQADAAGFFIALEVRPEMVLQALQRFAGEEDAGQPGNLRLLWCDAARLADIFAPGEVSTIYLNFPDPWPKNRHQKRRLTAPSFLSVYQHILQEQGQLCFKTDNLPLFEWSKENFLAGNWHIQHISNDLPLAESAIVTEYESRYRKRGQPIFYLAASPGEGG
ncbi:MAG: tRNA (guanosine(46)-N7)-methyltransferase TrmB [Firmicutes bacterium]|nr:tRNA (guanosine(46)-N7)-methyltransferase TrmB [Bacillota bacterium]